MFNPLWNIIPNFRKFMSNIIKKWQFLMGVIVILLSLVLIFTVIIKRTEPITDGQWTMPAGNFESHRYSELDQINSKNAYQLQVAWTFSTEYIQTHQGAPLVVNDIMYLHTPFPNTVFALDLNNENRILWRFESRQQVGVLEKICCSVGNRGLAYSDGKIFLHQLDTTLVALDALTGELLWSVLTGVSNDNVHTNTAAILVAKDKIIVGIGGGEYGILGYISAYNSNTGKLIWRGYSAGYDQEMLIDPEKTTELGKSVGSNSSLNSWLGDQWKLGGGATWGWYSYDEVENLLYYGSGNPAPWNPIQRPGDNKWTNSIFARDLDTGKVKWVYQVTPHDQWDFDAVNEMILIEREINGTIRKLLVHFNRNGFVYTLDRISGDLLDARKYDPSVNWATKIELDKNSENFGRPQLNLKYSPEHQGEYHLVENICPSQLGLKNKQAASYSEKLGLFFVPTIHLCMDYEVYDVKYVAGHVYLGASSTVHRVPNSHDGGGNFIAWDYDKGEIVWSIPEIFPVWSSPLATAGGVVFYGTFEGYFKAVNSKTGEILYKFKTPSGIVGNVMTYIHSGKQYVAVMSGYGRESMGAAAGLIKSRDNSTSNMPYRSEKQFTSGGVLTVFSLPD